MSDNFIGEEFSVHTTYPGKEQEYGLLDGNREFGGGLAGDGLDLQSSAGATGYDFIDDHKSSIPQVDISIDFGLHKNTDVDPKKGELDEIDNITGIPTGIDNGNNRIIFSRFQEKSWITSDGTIHVMANTNDHLTLYSSQDQGESWDPTVELFGTDRYSSSDGILVGDRLLIVYSTGAGILSGSLLSYSNETGTWSALPTTPFRPPAYLKIDLPSVAITQMGTPIISFRLNNMITRTKSLHVAYRHPSDGKWALLGGPIASIRNSDKLSGKIISTDSAFGLIYLRENITGWLGYSRESQRFRSEILLERADTQLDPSNTHWSTVTDSLGNIHLLTNDGDWRVVYLRYDADSDKWREPVTITDYDSGSYMQISILENGTLMAVYNVKDTDYLEVSESLDGGNTWSVRSRLTQDITESPGFPRMESPSHANDFLPVFQQVQVATTGSRSSEYSLVYYNVN